MTMDKSPGYDTATENFIAARMLRMTAAEFDILEPDQKREARARVRRTLRAAARANYFVMRKKPIPGTFASKVRAKHGSQVI